MTPDTQLPTHSPLPLLLLQHLTRRHTKFTRCDTNLPRTGVGSDFQRSHFLNMAHSFF